MERTVRRRLNTGDQRIAQLYHFRYGHDRFRMLLVRQMYEKIEHRR